MSRGTRSAALVALFLGLAAPTPAGELTVGSGASVDLSTGSLDLGCANLSVAGTLSAGSLGFDAARDVTIDPTGRLQGDTALLQVTGDWDNAGSFEAGSSTVRFENGCGLLSGVMLGNTSFASLEMAATGAARLQRFAFGSEQTVTQSLTLAGAQSSLLTLRSTQDGSEALLNVSGTQSVDFVDVQDNHATGDRIEYGPDSVIGTNTSGWVPVPEPSGAWLQAAALAQIAALACRRRRRNRAAKTCQDPT